MNKDKTFNIKAFYFDNDSTIFDHSGKGEHVRESVYEAFRKLKDNGYKVCLNTSRGYDEMYNVPKKLMNMFDYISLLSGAYKIHDGEIETISIDKEDTLNIIKMCDEYQLTYRYATVDGGGYLNQKDEDKEALFRRLYDMVPPIKKYEGEEVLHFIIYPSKDTSEKIINAFKHLEIANLGLPIEIGPKGINKGTSMLHMNNKFGYEKENACAFGDSANDVSMFENAGLSICMGNGTDAAKQKADYITSSTFEEGIYNALKHFDFIE